MTLIFNSPVDAIEYLTYHGFEPHGYAWIYRKRNDRSKWIDKLDPITSRKVEGKPQDFGINPLPVGRMRDE